MLRWASRQRLRLRLGQLVETAFTLKGAESGALRDRFTSAADECGADLREGDVQKKQDSEKPAWRFEKTLRSISLRCTAVANVWMAEAVPELPPMEHGLSLNLPPVDMVGEKPSIGGIIDGGRRVHLSLIAIVGHDQPTESDGKIDQPCRGRFRFALGLGVALAAMPAMAHSQAIERDPALPSDPRRVQVMVKLVKLQQYVPKVSLTGSLQPRFSTNVAFRISGKIEQRLVEVGDHITADQVLARVDPQVQQANLDSAKAGLSSAQALLTQASATFDRQTELLKTGFTTRQTYDEAEQGLRTQQAAVESAKAAVGIAEEQVGYDELRAGVAGIITARNAEIGQVVQAGETVFTIAQNGPRDAVFDVFEALLTDPPSPRVQVFLQADPSVVVTGTVREISPTVDPLSGTVKLKVGLDRVPPQMSLGAIVVGIGAFRSRPAIVIPRSALFRWDGEPAVWLFDSKSRTVSPRVIKIDRYAGEQLVLSEGVASGDSVVTAGIQFLRPGQVVRLGAEEQAP